MKLSKKSIISTLALSCLVIAPISAKKPTTLLSKIGHRIVQTANKHSYITTAGLLYGNYKVLSKILRTPESALEMGEDLAVLLQMTLAEWTMLSGVTNYFEIDPIK